MVIEWVAICFHSPRDSPPVVIGSDPKLEQEQVQAEGRDLVLSFRMCCGADRSSVNPVPSASPVNPAPTLKWDIANFVGRQLSTDERVAAVNVFTPDADFPYPTRSFGKQKNAFHARWLSIFNGLTYSPSQDAAYCLPRVLIPMGSWSVWLCSMWRALKESVALANCGASKHEGQPWAKSAW